MHPQSLMLFAAGLGTRMAPLTATRPKPLIPVAGMPLLDHALALADDAGVARTVVNVHYLPDQIRSHLKRRPATLVSDEHDALLETGGGLRKALPLLGAGPIFTLNTDAVWTGPNPLSRLASAWRPDAMDGLLMLIPQDRATAHTGRGDFRMAPDGRLTFGPGPVYTGAQIIRTDRLAAVPEAAFSLRRIWQDMAEAGRLFGIIHEGGWCDVGRPDAIPLAEALLRAAHV